MAVTLETPSRIWRRIEAIENRNRDMPSLPSLPAFDDSSADVERLLLSSDDLSSESDGEGGTMQGTAVHSTPAAMSHGGSTVRGLPLMPGSASSTARFARSIASRSSKSSTGPSGIGKSDSFDVSRIPSLPDGSPELELRRGFVDDGNEDVEVGWKSERGSRRSGSGYVSREKYDEVDDLSLSEALQSISRSGSPAGYLIEKEERERTPVKSYDYSMSLKSEAKPSPFEKFRNVAMRRPALRTRTPSLTHTSTSTTSSSANTTPHSTRDMGPSRSNTTSPIPGATVPLPPSRAATESPSAMTVNRRRQEASSMTMEEEEEQRSMSQSMQMQSMDITDIHISPAQLHQIAMENREEDQYVETTDTDDNFGETNDEDQYGLESNELVSTGPASSSLGGPEPTFSSEEDQPTPLVRPGSNAEDATFRHMPLRNSPATGMSAQSSYSLAFTPTPAFPRPRSRFNVAQAAQQAAIPQIRHEAEEGSDEQHSEEHYHNETETESVHSQQKHVRIAQEDPLTPHTRRKSFLLSVINSTARPRLKPAATTPHPRRFLTTPGGMENTPGPNVGETPMTTSRVAFAGVTPRPRLASVASSSNGSGGRQSFQSTSLVSQGSPNLVVPPHSMQRPSPRQWGTPGMGSPLGENVSFLSTASSHDLTTHQRLNTSFDPAMGFGVGVPGHGVGRFNTGKLNSYLHGLNRKMQDENEHLHAENLMLRKKLQEVTNGVSPDADAGGSGASLSNEGHQSTQETISTESRRLSGGRRVSVGGTVLDDVREDVVAEGWLEEKAELEEEVETYKEEIARIIEENERLERMLEAEQKERERDKDRWKERMNEVEQGVEVIIKELEGKGEESDKRAQRAEEERDQRVKELTRQLAQAEDGQALALERAEKAEYALESEKELGGELRDANVQLSRVMGDLQSANSQIEELEEDLIQSGTRIKELEEELHGEREVSQGLEAELAEKVKEVVKEKEQVRQLEEVVRQAEDELLPLKDYVSELEEQVAVGAERVATLEREVANGKREVQKLAMAAEEAQQQAARLEDVADKAQRMATQMEEALEEAESRSVHDQEVIAELRTKVGSLERELEREKQREPSKDLMSPTEADVQVLEEELDSANKEIARMKAIMNQSPARKAVDKAKDMRIEVLEREKEELLERNRALRMTMTEMNTPSKAVPNWSGISPMHRHVLSLSIRAPRTPGGPLKDLSWLNSTADPSVSPLISEISRLQRELDHANECIDDKLDKLEDAGLGVVGLTKKLEDARTKITSLEEEIARLSRKEDRLVHRMERIRCHKCHVKVNARAMVQADESSLNDNLPSEPETPPTRTSEALRTELRSVNAQLESLKRQWEDEKRQLVGENEALQDATNRLNGQIRRAQEEARRAIESDRAGEKAKAGVEGDLEKARRVIADLEDRLKSERAALRSLTAEQERLQREKNEVFAQLQRTESDMDDVRHQMQKVKQENHDLEKELRANSTAEQKARILEGRVSENLETIEQLRQERTLLATDYKQLQRRFTDLTEQANRLRSEHAASSTSHDKRRHQLDLYRIEIDDLKRVLSDKGDELHRAKKEKNRIAAEKEGVAKTVASLEADLQCVRSDAEAFGKDLRQLRAEKERMEESHKQELTQLERKKKQMQNQMRLLGEQLESQREVALKAREELRSHSCAMNDTQLSALKLQHNKECKGLIVQIRYLKAKFTRETTLRSSLCYQKQYLLILLGRYEKSEMTIFASIARIGFPVSPPQSARRKPWTLRSVVLAVLFSLRTKRASDTWREHCASKGAVAAALQDVRRRRALQAPHPTAT